MKRSELTVGAELFYQRSPYYSPDKVRVVAVEPHRKNPRWHNHASTVPHFEPADKGNMVLVEMPSPFDGKPRQLLVPLARLLGPWDKCNATYEAERKAWAENNRRMQEAREARIDRADSLVKAFAAADIKANVEGHTPSIVLDLDEAQKLLDLLNPKAPCGCPVAEVGTDGHRE